MAETSQPWMTPERDAQGNIVGPMVGDMTANGMGEAGWRRVFQGVADGVIPGSGNPAFGWPLEVYATGNDRRVFARPGAMLIQGAAYQATPIGNAPYAWVATVPRRTDSPTGTEFWRVVAAYRPAQKTVRLELRPATSAGAISASDPDGVWYVPLGTVPVGGNTDAPIATDSIIDDRVMAGVPGSYGALGFTAVGAETPTTDTGTRALTDMVTVARATGARRQVKVTIFGDLATTATTGGLLGGFQVPRASAGTASISTTLSSGSSEYLLGQFYDVLPPGGFTYRPLLWKRGGNGLAYFTSASRQLLVEDLGPIR